MAFSTTMTDYYVDLDLDSDTGVGTQGDPFGRLQYAVDSVTRDTTYGDRFLCKGSITMSSSLSLATYGNCSYASPVVFQGVNSDWSEGWTDDDVDLAEINMGGNNVSVNDSNEHYSHWINFKLGNTGSAPVLRASDYVTVYQCELHTTSNYLYSSSRQGGRIVRCYLHDCTGTYGLYLAGGTQHVIDCFLLDASSTAGSPIHLYASHNVALRNIVRVRSGATGSAIKMFANATCAFSNTVDGRGTGGVGIDMGYAKMGGFAEGNVIFDFSGTGGQGIDCHGHSMARIHRNAFYNNTTNQNQGAGGEPFSVYDNEDLGACPVAKSGSPTWANRLTYYAPVDTGNVYGGMQP